MGCSSKSEPPASISPEEAAELKVDNSAKTVEALRQLKTSIADLAQGVDALVLVRAGTSAGLVALPDVVAADASEFRMLRAGLDAVRANLVALGDAAPCPYARTYNLTAKALEAYASSRSTTAPAAYLAWHGNGGEQAANWTCP